VSAVRVFVISLQRAVARRAAAAAQLQQQQVAFEFFDAIEGATLAQPLRNVESRLYRLNTRRDALPAEIGCYTSHLAVWKICVALNRPVVVLEDDFQLEAGFAQALSEVETVIHAFGFIRLQAFTRKRPIRRWFRRGAYSALSLGSYQLHYLSDVPLCMLAYAINPKTAGALVEASATLIAPVDKFLQRTWEHGTPIFALTPAVVTPSIYAGESYIGDRSAKSRDPRLLFDRLLYKAAGELRRIEFDNRQLQRLPATPTAAGLARRAERAHD
jgi:glycosyl transferase family 25